MIGTTVTPAQAATAPQGDVKVHLSGELVVLQEEATTPNADGAERSAFIVTANGSQVPVDPADLPNNAATGADVDATAVADADLVSDAGIRVSGTVESGSAAGKAITEETGSTPLPLAAIQVEGVVTAASGVTHTVDVAVVTTGGQVAPFNDAQVDGIVATASEFWTDQASNGISGISRVNPVSRYTTTAGCNQNNLWNEAAAKFGMTPSTYYNTPGRHLLVISPNSCANGAIGLATVGAGLNSGGTVWMADVPGGNAQTIAHEFGHNFSLGHSNTHNCKAPVVDGVAGYTSGCSDQAYGDLYDTMAASYLLNGASNPTLTALNVTQRARLNTLGADMVTAPTGTNQFTLNAASAGSGSRGVKVTDPVSNVTYYVEYRNATGRDTNALYTRYPNPSANERPRVGTGVRILKQDAGGQSVVIPKQVSTGIRSFVWAAGDTFRSGASGVTVKIDAITGSTATLTVTTSTGFLGDQLPTIVGDRLQGAALTAVPGTDWAPKPTSYAYQWMREGAPIAGATAAKYTLTASDLQKNLTVAVTAKVTGRPNRTWVSAAVAVPPISPFTGTNKPAITFTGTEPVKWGTKLTAVPDAGWAPKPTSFKYQWYRNGALITGATTAAYTVKDADMTAKLTVAVTAVRAGVTSVTWTSNQVQVGVLSSFAGSFAAPVTGKFNVGQALAVAPAGLTPAPKFTYQWFAGTEAIVGATAKTYTLKAADLGKVVNVKVTAAAPGYTTSTWTVAGSAVGAMLPFVGTPATTITGDPVNGKVLTATASGLTPAPTSYKYQWAANGVDIVGAAAKTYTLKDAEVGKKITVKVTAVNAAYVSRDWISAQTATVAEKPSFTGSALPTVTGATTVGQVLTATAGSGWTPATTTFKYQWLRNGTPIAGATAKTYKLAVADKTAKLSVTVTATKTGYKNTAWTSAQTATVN
ncbi:hypothetical protein ASF30_12615 [Leifsonia sp. Leaf264]|nr:hypothetical protein ASF30_12615 [Leifsonia sp. Leaf264]